MTDEFRQLLHKGRAKCPKCGRKGLGFADHPHAFGYKDYDRFKCRYCRKVFKEKSRASAPPAGPDKETPMTKSEVQLPGGRASGVKECPNFGKE